MQRVALLVLAFLASAASAQFPGQPEKTEPLQLLPLAEVQKQVAEARGYQAEGLPDAEARKKVVARANGQPITLDEVLSEVMNRFGTPLTFGLLNQEFMRMETIRRKTVITPEEFAEGVQLYLAQKKSMQAKTTLRQLLEASRMSWDTFERMVSDQVKIQKEVRADLNMPKRPEPLNPFVLQIWAGQKLRGQYSMEQDPARMPPGVLGEVHTTRSVGDLLADVASTPGQWTTSAVQGEKAPEIDGGAGRGRVAPLPGAGRAGGSHAGRRQRGRYACFRGVSCAAGEENRAHGRRAGGVVSPDPGRRRPGRGPAGDPGKEARKRRRASGRGGAGRDLRGQ